MLKRIKEKIRRKLNKKRLQKQEKNNLRFNNHLRLIKGYGRDEEKNM